MKKNILTEGKSTHSGNPDTNSRPVLLTEKGQVFEIPAGGSLGLLALGYLGLMAWRDVRRNASNSTS